MLDENTLKLNLLNFLEKNGAYSPSGQAVLPGGNWADLNAFLPQSGMNQQQLEELLQKMRASWQLAAFWLNDRWMAFYTPEGHAELNRLRGQDLAPPAAGAVDMASFWLNLENSLQQQGMLNEAQAVRQLRAVPVVLETSRQVLAKLA